MNNQIVHEISPLYNYHQSLYFALLGQKSPEKADQKRIESAIPEKLYHYKFLLHPYRLAVMKMLYNHSRLSSLEIKETLSLSWSDYNNVVNALKKRGYVTVNDDFEDSVVRRFVFLEEAGRLDFQALEHLLRQFLDNAPIVADDDHDSSLMYPM